MIQLRANRKAFAPRPPKWSRITVSSRTTMIGPDEALTLVLHQARSLPPRSVPLTEACGLSLAEPIPSDRDYPPFDRAMMDGYAVRVAHAGRAVRVVGQLPAGQAPSAAVTGGECFEIMTGAPCPAGTEAVVPKEDVVRDGDCVVLPPLIQPGQHLAPQGSECVKGSTVLEQGITITPLAVAVIASFGRSTVRVVPRPSLGIITTGGELVGTGHIPGPAQIRDSNGPMIAAMAASLGLPSVRWLHADDRADAILGALRRVADRDVILLTGGVSVGTYDLVPQTLRQYGAEVVFHKVAQKPGKPLLFARRDQQLLFGLPGNPLASHMCFHRYVAAALRQMAGKPAQAQPLRGRLTKAARAVRSRTFFVTARAEPDRESGDGWLVEPLPGGSSADIFGACRANCYVEVPQDCEGIPAGTDVSFTWVIHPL